MLDGDGTVYDTLDHAAIAAFQAVNHLGVEVTIDEVHDAFAAEGFPGALKVLSPTRDSTELKSAFYHFDVENGFDTVELFPGAEDNLVDLKKRGIALGLVTSRNKETTESILDRLNLGGVFDAIITADDAGQPKPSPESVYRALAVVGGNPDSTVYMGDTVDDIRTAQNAELAASIGFTAGFTSAERLHAAGADFTLGHWSELPGRLLQCDVINFPRKSDYSNGKGISPRD